MVISNLNFPKGHFKSWSSINGTMEKVAGLMAKTNFANEEIEYPLDLLVINLEKTLDSITLPFSSTWCIYRVPKKLRSMNEAAYTPQFVSIGPLHYGKKTLKNMQKYKFWYLRTFLNRPEVSVSFDHFVSAIKRLEPEIRCCYAETFDYLCSHEFVHMILVDAGFIFELFLRDKLLCWREENDPISFKPWLRTDIEQDLILLENQLPFFILQQLYDLAFPVPREINLPSFRELTFNYFSNYKKQNNSIQQEVKHFTDLLRSFQLHGILVNLYSAQPKIDRIDNLYSATKLHDAGVKFKRSISERFLDTDIKYRDRDGVLTIPCLKLSDDTERFIRNLMALEQCHYPEETYICDYVYVMDCLINTAKDVDLLVEEKIIDNILGDGVQVATLFNNLCTQTCLSDHGRYNEVCKRLNDYYEVPWHNYKATLSREYLSTPWRRVSLFAAIMLLFLSWTQAICSFFSLPLHIIGQRIIAVVVVAGFWILLFIFGMFSMYKYIYVNKTRDGNDADRADFASPTSIPSSSSEPHIRSTSARG